MEKQMQHVHLWCQSTVKPGGRKAKGTYFAIIFREICWVDTFSETAILLTSASMKCTFATLFLMKKEIKASVEKLLNKHS